MSEEPMRLADPASERIGRHYALQAMPALDQSKGEISANDLIDMVMGFIAEVEDWVDREVGQQECIDLNNDLIASLKTQSFKTERPN